jgi:hypothetical protein
MESIDEKNGRRRWRMRLERPLAVLAVAGTFAAVNIADDILHTSKRQVPDSDPVYPSCTAVDNGRWHSPKVRYPEAAAAVLGLSVNQFLNGRQGPVHCTTEIDAGMIPEAEVKVEGQEGPCHPVWYRKGNINFIVPNSAMEDVVVICAGPDASPV